MNGIVKYHLKREIRRKIITFEELWTLFCEVERIVNERPLSYVSESEVLAPLRPIDIILPGIRQKVNITPPAEDLDDPEFLYEKSSKESLMEQYKVSVNCADRFWREWRQSYLTSLREKHKSCQNQTTASFPQKGDVVLIGDKEAPRALWKIGRITELISSRTAKLKTWHNGKMSTLERATNSLFPLELTFEYANDPHILRENVASLTISCPIFSDHKLTKIRKMDQDDGVKLHSQSDDEMEEENNGSKSPSVQVTMDLATTESSQPPAPSQGDQNQNEMALEPDKNKSHSDTLPDYQERVEVRAPLLLLGDV